MKNKIEYAFLVLILVVVVVGGWYIMTGKNTSQVPKVLVSTSEKTPETQTVPTSPALPPGVTTGGTSKIPATISGSVSKTPETQTVPTSPALPPGVTTGGTSKIPATISGSVSKTPETQTVPTSPALPPGVTTGGTSKIPATISGSVSKINGQKITIKGAKGESIIVVNTKTIFSKRGIDNKSISATFADIKISLPLVVYYTSRSGSDYVADEIVIFNMISLTPAQTIDDGGVTMPPTPGQ